MSTNTTKKGLSVLLAALLAAAAVFGAVGTVAAASGAWDTETTASTSTTEIGSAAPYGVTVGAGTTGNIVAQTDGVTVAKSDLELHVAPVNAPDQVVYEITADSAWTTVNSSAGQYKTTITHKVIRNQLPRLDDNTVYQVTITDGSGNVLATGDLAVTFDSSEETARIDVAANTTGLADSPVMGDEFSSEKRSPSGIAAQAVNILGASTVESIPVIGGTMVDVDHTATYTDDIPVDTNTTAVRVNLAGTDAASALNASMDTTKSGDRIPAALFIENEPAAVYEASAPSDVSGYYAVVQNSGDTLVIKHASGSIPDGVSELNVRLTAGQGFDNGVGPNQDTLFDGLGLDFGISNIFGGNSTSSGS